MKSMKDQEYDIFPAPPWDRRVALGFVIFRPCPPPLRRDTLGLVPYRTVLECVK
jgi:hypothetical protein